MAKSKATKGLLWTPDGRAYKENLRTGKKIYYADLDKSPDSDKGATGEERYREKYPDKYPDRPPKDGGTPDPNGDYPDPTPGDPRPWDVVGTEPSRMDFDTYVEMRDNPLYNPYFGEGDGPNVVTDEGDGTGTTLLNPDGSVRLGDVSAHQREVQDNELVSEHMNSLLASDSKFIQDARRQGLEQANALGGLGGTAGIGAAQQSAMRAALPIAEADAQAFRTAATENLEALNRFSQLNHQRATQLELGQIDAKTRLETTKIGASVTWASNQLNAATQRDIAKLDSETKLRVTEMSGAIQERMADLNYKYSAMLNEQQNNYGLQNTALQGEYLLQQEAMRNKMQRETNYLSQATGIYDSFMNQLAQLNGVEMDAAAKSAAIKTITQGAQNMYALLNSLFPDMNPITFPGMSSGGQSSGYGNYNFRP